MYMYKIIIVTVVWNKYIIYNEHNSYCCYFIKKFKLYKIQRFCRRHYESFVLQLSSFTVYGFPNIISFTVLTPLKPPTNKL